MKAGSFFYFCHGFFSSLIGTRVARRNALFVRIIKALDEKIDLTQDKCKINMVQI